MFFFMSAILQKLLEKIKKALLLHALFQDLTAQG